MATPELLGVTGEPSRVVPSMKVTVPAGVPALELTVAVRVTGCPKTAVAVRATSEMVVAWAMVNVVRAEAAE